jgi:Flp pilus assembly protein CpaB
MNPRQRRGVLLVVVAVIGGIGVFTSIEGYVSRVRAREGEMTTVLSLTQEVDDFEELPLDAVETVEIPQHWAPRTALPASTDLVALVPASDLPEGTVLQRGMLVPRPALDENEREIAVLINADTGVALKVGPGDVVEIIGSFGGDSQTPPDTRIVISCARVIDVGLPSELTEAESEGFTQESVVPITFALTRTESIDLAHAEAFAKEVRLARVGPGKECTDALSPPTSEGTEQ